MRRDRDRDRDRGKDRDRDRDRDREWFHNKIFLNSPKSGLGVGGRPF